MARARAVRIAYIGVPFLLVTIFFVTACVGDTPEITTLTIDGGVAQADAETKDAGDAASLPLDAGPQGPGKKLVFVTSYTKQGNLGVSTGDDVCKSVSQRPDKMWRAWLSDVNGDAIDRVGDGAWYRVDGKLVFPNRASLASPPEVALNQDENGVTIRDGESVWTGTDENGHEVADRCGGWKAISGQGYVGKVGGKGKTWTASESVACNLPAHLYCFEL